MTKNGYQTGGKKPKGSVQVDSLWASESRNTPGESNFAPASWISWRLSRHSARTGPTRNSKAPRLTVRPLKQQTASGLQGATIKTLCVKMVHQVNQGSPSDFSTKKHQKGHLLFPPGSKMAVIPEPCKKKKAEIRNYFWLGLPLTGGSSTRIGFEHVAQVRFQAKALLCLNHPPPRIGWFLVLPKPKTLYMKGALHGSIVCYAKQKRTST